MICDICGVNHKTTHADLSHGIIRLLMHSQELRDWEEWPISGDKIALLEDGKTSLLHLVDWRALGADEDEEQ
ncbi:hypothetical protein SEA_EASTWEST_53 [Arthrobacter phage EastWest]|uniref:Uncharacterized protein n=1 Tax=Arthrobacter phage EastWest TaxID=2894292 RepID=A0AAE9C9K7_9CAUD|nr:hypothetical protein SEA_EASTWEST_53 [Arthrobacter phage EastWest]